MAVAINGTTGISANAAGFLVGQVAMFAMSVPPSGFLKMNGAAVSRTTYSALFAAIGTTYGAGNGTTTFNLPEVRGEFLRCLDDGRGVDAGRAVGSAQLATRIYNGTQDDGGWGGRQIDANLAGGADYDAGTAVSVATGTATTQSFATGGVPITNPVVNTIRARPRNVAFLACIFAGV